MYLALGPRGKVDFPEPGFLDDIFDDRPEVAGICFETCSDPSAYGAVRWIRKTWPGMRTIVSFTYRGDPPTTITGRVPEDVARSIEADVLGVNCGLEQSPELVGRVLEAYRVVSSLPLFARPNAGSPGRTMDAESWAQSIRAAGLVPADQVASTRRNLVDGDKPRRSSRNALMLGGCCGTTPDHISRLCAMATALRGHA